MSVYYNYHRNPERSRQAPIEQLPGFAYPIVKAPHPLCELCSWTYSPDITHDPKRPFVLKCRNQMCFSKHLEEVA
jgi:hypothetical protein